MDQSGQNGETVVPEAIQRVVARLIATSPAGQGLSLIGGFRYRLLDEGPRRSMDVDYHWDGDLSEKQSSLARLLAGKLIPEVNRRFGYEGRVGTDTNPGTASPLVRVVNLAFWHSDPARARIEIPVDITRIVCLDGPVVRTVGGVVYRTVSDADLVEGKIVSVFTRAWLEHRDIVDIFLFASHLASDYVSRTRRKLKTLGVAPSSVAERMRDLSGHRGFHSRTVTEVVRTQLDRQTAENILAAGGGEMVLDAVLGTLTPISPDSTDGVDQPKQGSG